MGKRKSEKSENIKNKIRKLEKKLQSLTETRNDSPKTPPPTSPITLTPSSPTHEVETAPETEPEPGTSTADTAEENLPEEFLLALGHEGEEQKALGEPIRNELATRWTKIISEGLKKEQKEALLNKYPTPTNFQIAVAPILNKEISATLSDSSLNRDKRFIARQNLTGKLLTCLGKSLTAILKGDINSKKLIEEINDAAKIAAEMYHGDTKSRTFFALSYATKAVQDACKDTNPGKYLFGDNLNEQLKAIQTIKRTAAQIKVPENKTSWTPKPLNWRSPPQYQQSRRGRGGQQLTRRPAMHQPPRRPLPTKGTQKHPPRRTNHRRY